MCHNVSRILFCYSDQGSTCPYRCILDNDELAVVKYLNNPAGNLTLINEYISYNIAKELNLSVPKCGLCSISKETEVDKSVADSQFSPTVDNFGLAFYSKYVQKTAVLMHGLISSIANLDQFIKMVVFDHIIYNKDRNKGDILIDISLPKISMVLIDHTHVFKNQTIWDRYTFQQGIAANDYEDTIILEYNSDVYNYFWEHISFDEAKIFSLAEEYKRKLTPECIHSIIQSLPSDWSSLINPLDLDALEEYIDYRVANLDNICEMICIERRRKNG